MKGIDSIRRTKGFTIIELMIVLAILGILVLMGVPSLKSFIDDARLNAAATEFMTDAVLTRSTAVKLGCDVTMAPKSSSWQNGWTVTYKALNAATAQCDPVGTSTVIITVKDHAPLSSITVAAVTGSITAFAIGFDARLNDTATAPSLKFVSDNTKVQTRCINVNATGKPNLKAIASSGTC